MKQRIQLTKVLMSCLFCISIGFAQIVVEGDLTENITKMQTDVKHKK